MAPVAAIIIKESKTSKCGIGFKQAGPKEPVKISSIAVGSLFAATDLIVGMQVLSINNIPIEEDTTQAEAIQILKDAEGQITVVADIEEHKKKCGYIIMKKTVKYTEFNVKNQKFFTFHGPMTEDMIQTLNGRLEMLRVSEGSSRLKFSLDTYGHYKGSMNHHAQERHEEDFVIMILEAMELMGWHFRFQYDAESFSNKFMQGASYTAKELFIFHQMA